jgi:threonine dehydratase
MVTRNDVLDAAERIRPYIHRTPVLTSRLLNDIVHAQLFFKCENMQKAGAFKGRGATNAIRSLTDAEAARGVATHSSGNHGSALAWAAQQRGIPCTVVIPNDAPAIKVYAARSYGANIVFCENTPEGRTSALDDVVRTTNAIVIHPYDNDTVIAGQGTCALELLEDHPDLDIIIAPVGGGGLCSGVAAASSKFQVPGSREIGSARSVQPGTRNKEHGTIYGAEPQLADDAYRSMASGILQPPTSTPTIADGLRAGICERTFTYMQHYGVKVLTCSEDVIRVAQRLLMTRLKTVVEPSGAVSFAAVMEHAELFRDAKVGVVISGGNVDPLAGSSR